MKLSLTALSTKTIDNLDVPNDPTPHETDNADTVEVTPDEIDDDEANSIETADDYENNGPTPQETTGADPNADKTRVTDHNDGWNTAVKTENDAESPKTADDLVSPNKNDSSDAPDETKIKAESNAPTPHESNLDIADAGAPGKVYVPEATVGIKDVIDVENPVNKKKISSKSRPNLLYNTYLNKNKEY